MRPLPARRRPPRRAPLLPRPAHALGAAALLTLAGLTTLSACRSHDSRATPVSRSSGQAAVTPLPTATVTRSTLHSTPRHSRTPAAMRRPTVSRQVGVLFAPSFPPGTRLVTNELAFREPDAPGAQVSPYWLVTSGSLYARDGAGWTGTPDTTSPNAGSTNGTDSAVFRVVSRRADFRDVRVRLRLRVNRLVTAASPNAYDGVHIFLRYQTDKHLYTVTVMRRDDIVVVKKKVPGGSANGGTYTTLAEAPFRFPRGGWVPVEAAVTDMRDGVRFQLTIAGRPVLTALDRGAGGTPIRAAGRVGLRGDNCDFDFRDFQVVPASDG